MIMNTHSAVKHWVNGKNMNKYYIPTTYEIKVGLEVETNNCSTAPKEEQEWNKLIVSDDIIDGIILDISGVCKPEEVAARTQSIRIKYTNIMDLYLLGWKRYCGDGPREYTFEKGQHWISFDEQTYEFKNLRTNTVLGIAKNNFELEKILSGIK